MPLHLSKTQTYFAATGILLLFLFMAFCYGLAYYPLLNMNEGLYAEIAREMLSRGDFIIPHLNAVPYLEKPPLLYWLISLSYHAFGITTFAARLIPCLSGISICFATIWFAKQNKQTRIGFYAAIILASSLGFIVMSRMVFFDVLLTALMSLSLMTFYLWYTQGYKYFLYLTYIFLGFAFLTKGALALIIIGIITFSFMILHRTPREKYLAFLNPLGISLFLLIILPWHLFAIKENSDFVFQHFINEQVYRFLDKRFPHDYHTGPFYYYLPRIIVYLFPWTLFIPWLIKEKIKPLRPLTSFLWIWLIAPLLFFSLAKAKGDYYMVIAMPALSLLIALQIDTFIKQKRYQPLLWIFALTSIALSLTAFYFYFSQRFPPVLTKDIFYLACTLSCITVGGVFIGFRYRNPFTLLLLIALLAIPLLLFYLQVKSKLIDRYSTYTTAQYIKIHVPTRATFLFRDLEKVSSILFFLQRPLPIIDSLSKDLSYGSTIGIKNQQLITHTQFLTQYQHISSYILVREKNKSYFNKIFKKSGFCLLEKNGKLSLFTNKIRECPIDNNG